MRTNFFDVLGLPSRDTDSRTLCDAYQHQRRVWFRRQFEPEHALEAGQRLRRIDRAYESLREEPARRRHLKAVLSGNHVLKDRRRGELHRFAQSLADRPAQGLQSRRLLHFKALALGLNPNDADEVLLEMQRRRLKVVPRDDRRREPSPRQAADSNADSRFRFAVRVAAAQGPIDTRRSNHLMDRARRMGISPHRARLILDDAQAQARERRRRWLRRLWGFMRGDLNLDVD